MSQSNPDFSRLSPKLRAVLHFRASGYTTSQISKLTKVRYGTIESRLAAAVHAMGVESIDDAIRAWRKHPQRDNSLFWELLDTLRETTKEWSRKHAGSVQR